MQSLSALVVRLNRAVGADRRLDAEVVATVLAPKGCVLDPIEMLDGWDIQFPPDEHGESTVWREAADIVSITTSVDAASELVIEACPTEAATILSRAFEQVGSIQQAMTATEFVSRTARMISAELLGSIAGEKHRSLAQVA